ncbi:DUF3570 domain-containing protein [Pontibacter sp. G13]|uniref:DUF3570 domain-containing protein n=1 Tax=Pontibacter sp. G13 TaxID=3074898 RepID=UPI00288A37BE|nr:DUF3570 domain-containing protein [Pontibacter sp. G13]WNJ19664.1 DUF3570 domain-containing protein [Pontibacter sp. G13]
MWKSATDSFACMCVLLSMLAFPITGQAQSSRGDSLQPALPVDVDFLFNYYEQEGVHSAVTGGIGSEELTDFASQVHVFAPLDSFQALQVQASLNHYTSASTDRIDSYVSSASRRDSRTSLVMGYQQKDRSTPLTWGVRGGMGIESDYFSSSLGGTVDWSPVNGSRSWTLDAQAYWDRWIVIYPEELRELGLVSVPTDKRRSYSLSFTLNQIINPRLQASITGAWVLQQGLLSTPFHRVYRTPSDSLPTIERLPTSRFKFPIGIRANYFAWDFLVLRGYYRLYLDTFDLLAHSMELETPIKLGNAFTIAPFVRYHIQQGSKFFAPYQEHDPSSAYYTSDYDLSGFSSTKWGAQITIAPAFGLMRFRSSPRKMGMFRSLDLRGSRYDRSDGLNAWTLSLGMNWQL